VTDKDPAKYLPIGVQKSYFLLPKAERGHDFSGAKFARKSLSEANLSEADFSQAILSEADLEGADLCKESARFCRRWEALRFLRPVRRHPMQREKRWNTL
jgi:hypothetical protein